MIDIIIATYNGSSRIGELLSSIAKQSCQDYRCILVDDNSTDDTVKYVQNQFQWVEIIQLPNNKGPSHARNIGIADGYHPYVAFFDDDAYIDDPHWLINAIQLFKNNSRVGQIAAMIVNAKNPEMLLDCGIFQYTYKFGGLFHGHQRDQVNDLHKMRRLVLGACSAGTVIRRSVLEEIGGFDARYFYPVEDLDVSLRVHLAGLDVIYDPSFLVYHYESQTMEECISRKMYLCRRNCLLALVDNYPIVFIIKMISKMILQEILLPLSCFAGRVTLGKTQVSNLNKIFDYIRALSFLFTITVSTIKKRRAVNKFRRRSRSYLCNVNNQFLKSLENFALFYRYGDLH